MINLERLKVILDTNFKEPFLGPNWVSTQWGPDGHLVIKIASRDIEIDEDGQLHAHGTDLTWTSTGTSCPSQFGMVGKKRLKDMI